MKKEKQNDDNFIMLPTVDFCFKELMRNPKVRKGFIAAVLGKKPEEIRDTTLIPTELRKESEDDKLGCRCRISNAGSTGSCFTSVRSIADRSGRGKNMTGCTAASMSGSWTLSIFRRIRNVSGNSPSVTWKQGNSIPT